MKDYRRNNPLFALCGLNCALCPIHHMETGCPGCGGGEGHQSCPVIRCSLEHGSIEFCSLCADFPCRRLEEQAAYDSFLPHRNMLHDLKSAGEMGMDAYRQQLLERNSHLEWLLANCNDGRRKTFYCTMVNLLPLPALRAAMARISGEASASDPLKARAAVAVRILQDTALEQGMDWRLHKPSQKT